MNDESNTLGNGPQNGPGTPPPHSAFDRDANEYPHSECPYQSHPYRPDNYLILSIICTIFCCLPFGIVAIYYGSKVDNCYYNRDYAGAMLASNRAKSWCIAGFVSILLIDLLLFLIIPLIFGISLLSFL